MLLAASATLCLLAPFQSYGSDVTIDLSGAPGNGQTVHTSRVADINGDAVPDVVIQRGGSVVALYSPTGSSSVGTVLASGVIDFDIHVGGGGDGEWDSIVATTSGGLVTAGLAPEATVFSFGAELDSTWDGAVFVRMGDVDGDDVVDRVGVASNGTTVIFQPGLSTGGFGTVSTFSITPSILALELMDNRPLRDGLEIVTATSNGLRTWDEDGAPRLAKHQLYTPDEAIGALGVGSVIGWITGGTSDQVFATVFDPATSAGQTNVSMTASTAFDLTSDDFVSVAFGDLYLTALPSLPDYEVVLNDATAGNLVILHSPTSGPPAQYSASNKTTFDYDLDEGEDPAVNTANPIVHDLDADGYADLAFTTEHLERFDLWYSDSIPGASQPAKDGVSLAGERGADQNPSEALARIEDEFKVHIHIDNIPDGTTHYHVVVWEQPTTNDYLDPVAISREVIPVAYVGDPADNAVIDVVFENDESLTATYHLQMVPLNLPGRYATGQTIHGAVALTEDNVEEPYVDGGEEYGNDQIEWETGVGTHIDLDAHNGINDKVDAWFVHTRVIGEFPPSSNVIASAPEIETTLADHGGRGDLGPNPQN